MRAMFGLAPINILTEEYFFLPMVIVSGIVKETGWGTIIYLAAILNIDRNLYEAATIDGAGRLAQVFSVTLPGMLPIISIFVILSVPGLLSAGFDQIYNLMNPMIARAANVTDIYVLRVGIMQGQFAYATAIGLVFGMVSFILLVSANKVAGRSMGSGLW